jgi:hypothetical protein
MKVQDWVFSNRYADVSRRAIVGPARSSTVESALHLAGVPEEVRAEIRADATVRLFVEGTLDPEATGYYIHNRIPGTPTARSWLVCMGPVHEVVP